MRMIAENQTIFSWVAFVEARDEWVFFYYSFITLEYVQFYTHVLDPRLFLQTGEWASRPVSGMEC